MQLRCCGNAGSMRRIAVGDRGAVGAMPQSRATVSHRDRRGSWMLPGSEERNACIHDNPWRPRGRVRLRLCQWQLSRNNTKLSYPSGACSDARGNVFIAMQNASEVYEYAHGGTTPIAILSTEGYQPQSCSVDRNTGNLAVCGDKGFNEPGAAAVFQNEQGSPTIYPTYDTLFFCAYDNHSNLFADVGNLLPLPNGSSAFKSIFINGNSGWYHGSIQWDGGAFAINAPTGNPRGPAVVYRVSVSGSQVPLSEERCFTATAVATTTKLIASSGITDPGSWPARNPNFASLRGVILPAGSRGSCLDLKEEMLVV